MLPGSLPCARSTGFRWYAAQLCHRYPRWYEAQSKFPVRRTPQSTTSMRWCAFPLRTWTHFASHWTETHVIVRQAWKCRPPIQPMEYQFTNSAILISMLIRFTLSTGTDQARLTIVRADFDRSGIELAGIRFGGCYPLISNARTWPVSVVGGERTLTTSTYVASLRKAVMYTRWKCRAVAPRKNGARDLI
jgi:hypothetical protein